NTVAGFIAEVGDIEKYEHPKTDTKTRRIKPSRE
ncbi:hypothetical protein TheetDRAFT_2926, partial [Thermoanaerobacter ethanolicus JW 200]